MSFTLKAALSRTRPFVAGPSQSISCWSRRWPASGNRPALRASYAAPASNDSAGFRIPTTEREVAEVLANARSQEERKKIFEALLGTREVASKLPPKPRGPTGVHLVPIGRTKLSSEQTGVDVHHSPFEALVQAYEATLAALEKIPSGAVYRQATEGNTRTHLEIVKKYVNAGVVGEGAEAVEERVRAAEAELGVGMIEKAIEQAEDEYGLALKMIEFEAWQELIEKPAAGQWDSFKVPPSTSYPQN